jgi:hypothetical protein
MMQVLNTSKSLYESKEEDNIYDSKDELHGNLHKTQNNQYEKMFTDTMESKDFKRTSDLIKSIKFSDTIDSKTPISSSRLCEEEKEPDSGHDLMMDINAIQDLNYMRDNHSMYEKKMIEQARHSENQITYNIHGEKVENDEEIL